MTYVVGDVMTGRVFEFPLRSEGHQELRLDARLASRAVIARWVRYTDKDSSDNLPIVNCLRQDFVWNGISAEALAKPVVVATVKSDELEQCDN